MKKYKHFMYVPFTGLGNYGGYRGARWLRNRIQVFKQFVIPSLQAQTSHNFILWVSWRWEERKNPQVVALKDYLDTIKEFQTVFTYNGVCFWDDKYPNAVARERVLTSIRASLTELTNYVGDVDEVLLTLQPSDDCYQMGTVESLQNVFQDEKMKNTLAIGFAKGYMCNYRTLELAEYNPKTNPPFFTIRFPKKVFIDPPAHANHISIKHDILNEDGTVKYPAGSPYPSHEYMPDVFGKGYCTVDIRGFLVGTHSENISTHFNHPYKGADVDKDVLRQFGLQNAEVLKIKVSIRKWLLRKLPHRAQRKLRYIFGELIWQRMYNFLRG